MRSIAESLPGYWQDKIIVALSLLLAASPWLFGYTDLSVAQWDAVVIAGTLALGSIAVTLWEPYWPNFVTAFLAFWLVLSPRILGFSGRLVPTLIAAAVGAVVIVLALWSAIRRSHDLLAERSQSRAEPPSRPTSGN
jgi:hypothetical protein